MKWHRISRATKLLSRIFEILKIPRKKSKHFLFFKISPSKSKFSKIRKIWDGNGWWISVQTFKSISSKMAEIWHKLCQKQALSTSFRDFTAIFRILFFDRFWRFKSVLGSYFAFFAKIWPKTCITALSPDFLCSTFCMCLPGDLRWPWHIPIMVIKHRKWCLQMSETLSMPIRWICLSLTSKFCSPMSPSPRSRTFWLWPDLWRHCDPKIIIFFRQFFQGFQMPHEFL